MTNKQRAIEEHSELIKLLEVNLKIARLLDQNNPSKENSFSIACLEEAIYWQKEIIKNLTEGINSDDRDCRKRKLRIINPAT